MIERISKLDPRIQEYIKLGVMLNIFDATNLKRVVERLEKVTFTIDNNIPKIIQISSNADHIYIKQNENMLNAKDKPDYFNDCVLFHELTHAISGIYEECFQKESSFNLKNKISSFMNAEDRAKFDNYKDAKEYR